MVEATAMGRTLEQVARVTSKGKRSSILRGRNQKRILRPMNEEGDSWLAVG
jgi:hypothetical protein